MPRPLRSPPASPVSHRHHRSKSSSGSPSFAVPTPMAAFPLALSPPDSTSSAGVTMGADSGFALTADDALSRYPASVTSSVRAHVFEGGFRYHAYRDGKYPFPNDDVEQNRDDMKHAMTTMLLRGKHFYAPVDAALERGGEVLDLGTGTGIWVMEMAEKYPNTTFRGIDLSPIQPTFVPKNVFFAVDDIEDEWVYEEGSLDFIHVRHTLFSIADRETLLQRALKYLKPGGYIEFQELHYQPHCDDGTLGPSTPSALVSFLAYLTEGLRALGIPDPHAVTSLAAGLRAAGFADVAQTTHRCPLGPWPRDRRLRYAGLFMRTSLLDGLPGLARRPLVAGLGWSELQLQMFLLEVRKAIADDTVHAYFPLHVVHARKPLR